MELKKQICSLEFSKQLKELGVKQESVFYWRKIDMNGKVFWEPEYEMTINPFKTLESISAFTVAELGEMLPNYYTTGRSENNNYNCWRIRSSEKKLNFFDLSSDTEANARAKMIIHLLKNKVIIL